MKEKQLIHHFQHLYDLIQKARSRALLSVSYEQLHLFWQVGAYINQKLSEGSWGEKVVDQFSAWLKEKDPSVKNFARRNIYRMREFFLAYHNVSWSMGANGLSIGGSAKPLIESIDNEDNKKDFHSDLLFFHRELQCLLAFELKTTKFEPGYLGQLNFYLEALDRDMKKPHENPSIGVLLCKTKTQEVVEYALSRNMSPALVAEYQTRLIQGNFEKTIT